jgi:RNA polymerase sigma factor (sigma-70 family)
MMGDLTFLARAAREDPARQEEVIERLTPDVHRLAARYAGGDADLEGELDLVGHLAVLGAIRRFDPDREVDFSPFARHCIRNALLKFLRGHRRGLQHWVSLSDEAVAAEVDAQAAAAWALQDPLSLPTDASELAREDLRHAGLCRVVQGLTEEEWRLIYWRDGEREPYADIAARLGKSVAAVKQAHYRAWQKVIEVREQMFARGELFGKYLR